MRDDGVTGFSFLKRDGRTYNHELDLSVGEDGVALTLTGTGTEATETVRDGSREVSGFVRRAFVSLERTAYRERPALGDPKPTARTRRPDAPPRGTVVCPKCLGADLECGLCEGGGVVTPFAADEWTAQQGDGDD